MKSNVATFAVTKAKEIIKKQVLPKDSSVFSAEIIAIQEAVAYTKNKLGKFAICSDSLSSLKAIANPNNKNIYATLIRSELIFNQNLKLIWVPSHCGIPGNVLADISAKEASDYPLTTHTNVNPTDINRFLKNRYKHKLKKKKVNCSSSWYQQIHNPKVLHILTMSTNTRSFSRKDLVTFTRIRLGHTKHTHTHTLDT